MNSSIGCVIVTYNRLDKLKKALAAYENQLVKPCYIVVVDNASTDGTRDFLCSWKKEISEEKRYVLSLDENIGGSGGFFVGQEMAMKLSADWIMLSDDDGYPEPDYIKGIKTYIDEHNCDDIAVLCGSLMEHGSNINSHRAVYLKHFCNNNLVKPAIINELKMMNDLYYINHSSYVGPVIKKSAIKNAGMVNKDFFIWFDDFEHMHRLGQVGKIGYLPQYKMLHDVAKENDSLSWKTYYGLRNKLYFLAKNYSIAYYVTLIVMMVKAVLCPLKGKSFTEVVLRLTAIKDASRNRLGIHDVYRPGWKP